MQKTPILLLLISIFSSCTIGRKFDYRSAYKFKYLRYEKQTMNDSLPSFLVFCDKKGIPWERLNIIQLQMRENPIRNKSINGYQARKIINSDVAQSKLNKVYKRKFTEVNVMSVQELKKNTNKTATRLNSGFHDLHPALQGFLIVAIGFGVVLTGALLGSLPTLSTILIIGGLVVAAIGFYIIATQI
jgi:hypothetical protein